MPDLAELKERSLADRNRCGARAPFLYSNLAGVRCHGRLPRTALSRLDDPMEGSGRDVKKNPATTYSPTQLPEQYHRHERA
jgi:hypothetical protein